jgi:hypothetical protein
MVDETAGPFAMTEVRGRDARLGIGLAGLIAGLLAGAMVLTPSPSGDASSVQQEISGNNPRSAQPVVDPLGPAIDALKRGRQALHSRVEDLGTDSDDTELPEALEAAIAADDWALDIRRVLHRRIGAGSFVTIAGLTPIGRALLERVNEIHDHAVDINSYQRSNLERLVAPLLEAEAADAEEPTPLQRLITQTLEGREFREERVRMAIKALGETPTVTDVEGLIATFQERQTGVSARSDSSPG